MDSKYILWENEEHYTYSYYYWRRKWQPALVFLPGESHGQRNLVGYSPCAHRESDTTEATQHTRTHYHLFVKHLLSAS